MVLFIYIYIYIHIYISVYIYICRQYDNSSSVNYPSIGTTANMVNLRSSKRATQSLPQFRWGNSQVLQSAVLLQLLGIFMRFVREDQVSDTSWDTQKMDHFNEFLDFFHIDHEIDPEKWGYTLFSIGLFSKKRRISKILQITQQFWSRDIGESSCANVPEVLGRRSSGWIQIWKAEFALGVGTLRK